MRQRNDSSIKTLDDYYAEVQGQVISRMCDVGRQSPHLIDEAALEWASRHLDDYAGTFFHLLIVLMARDEDRRAPLRALYLKLLPGHPADALRVAGYLLH